MANGDANVGATLALGTRARATDWDAAIRG
jgi:hypothetical protein